MINRDADGNAVLTCDVGDGSDLTVSWYKEDKIIQNEQKIKLLLTSAQVQENKPYSCSVSNPVSSEQSNNVTVSCKLFFFSNVSHLPPDLLFLCPSSLNPPPPPGSFVKGGESGTGR